MKKFMNDGCHDTGKGNDYNENTLLMNDVQ